MGSFLAQIISNVSRKQVLWVSQESEQALLANGELEKQSQISSAQQTQRIGTG